MGIFQTLRAKYGRKVCYTVKSKQTEVYLSICADLGAAKLITPQMQELVDVSEADFRVELAPTFSKAYKLATEANDQAPADEVHCLRQIICR